MNMQRIARLQMFANHVTAGLPGGRKLVYAKSDAATDTFVEYTPEGKIVRHVQVKAADFDRLTFAEAWARFA
jgi:hypothetical protein